MQCITNWVFYLCHVVATTNALLFLIMPHHSEYNVLWSAVHSSHPNITLVCILTSFNVVHFPSQFINCHTQSADCGGVW